MTNQTNSMDAAEREAFESKQGIIGRLAPRRWQEGDPLPPVGGFMLVSGANCDVESDQHREFWWRQVIGYASGTAFVCLQSHGCWPTVERTENCWIAEIRSAATSPQAAPVVRNALRALIERYEEICTRANASYGLDDSALVEAHAALASPDAVQAPSPWREIATFEPSDDEVWLYSTSGQIIEGPAAVGYYPDPEQWTHWAPAEPPSPFPDDAVQAAPAPEAKTTKEKACTNDCASAAKCAAGSAATTTAVRSTPTTPDAASPAVDPVREALEERVAFLLNATRDAQNHAADYGQRAVGHRIALLLVADAESLEEAKEAAHEELQRPYPPVTLSTFITAAQMWHKEAFPQAYTLTAEQKAANLRRPQGFEPLDTPPSPPDDTALLRQCLEAMEWGGAEAVTIAVAALRERLAKEG